jgi:hypothetical protein
VLPKNILAKILTISELILTVNSNVNPNITIAEKIKGIRSFM